MKPIYPLVTLSLLALALAGCGGSSSTATPTPVADTLSGTAAVGAPIVGATVTVRDSSSTTADKTTRTSASGSYSVDVSGLTAPYVLQVSGGTVGTSTTAAPTLYSAATAADVRGTINITPLTDLIVANTCATKASDCFTNFTTVPNGGSAPSAKVTTALLNAAEADLEASVRKILTAAGAAVNVDLLRTAFVANSTGLDKALDYVNVKVDAAGTAAVTYIGPNDAAAGVAKGQQFIDTFASLGSNVYSTAAGYTYVAVTIDGAVVSAPPAALIRGVAGTSGGIVSGGTVTVRDSSSAVDVTGTTDTKGDYSVNVSTLTAPYMLQVSGGNLPTGVTLYSAATAADAYGSINITPITDAIVAKATGKTAAAAFGATTDNGSGFSTLVTEAKLNTIEAAMQTALTAAMSGLTYMTSYAIPADFDLMRTFIAGGSGVANLTEITKVTVNADGTGTVTITPPTVLGVTPPVITVNF